MNTCIRFITIDDNLLDTMAINDCAQAFPELQMSGSYSNAMDGHSAILSAKPDLVFLDIEMPDFSGIQLLKSIQSIVPMCVFVTSHSEFALEGFELAALDYVLKPLTDKRFSQTMNRVNAYWQMLQKANAYEVLFEQQVLTIKDGYKHIRLATQDIIYLEAMQDYTKVVTTVKSYMTNMTLSGFMDRLSSKDFMRIHRSYAIALDKIKELHTAEVLCDTVLLPIGKTYRNAMSEIRWRLSL